MTEEKDIGDVYRDRNLLAIGFVRQALSDGFDGGYWSDDPESSYVVVWASIPEGQVGWHVKTDMVPASLPESDPDYDGYSRDEKNRRLADFIGLCDPDGTPKKTVATKRLLNTDS